MSKDHESECWQKVSNKYDPAYSQDFFHEGYIAGQSSIPELPPVSPEGLVEGEWYAWKSAGNIHVGQVYSCGTDSAYIRCGATGIPVMDWNLYYGPLRFKIGGAE